MAEPTSTPKLETVADRLDKLEQAMAALQSHARQSPALNGPLPEGLAAGPIGGQLIPAAVLRAVLPAAGPGETGNVWSRVPVLAELRLMARMYLDPRYRLSRIGQFGVPLAVALMVLNYLLWSTFNIPLLAFVFERVGFALLAVALYKVLSREAARYAAVLDYLAKYGR